MPEVIIGGGIFEGNIERGAIGVRPPLSDDEIDIFEKRYKYMQERFKIFSDRDDATEICFQSSANSSGFDMYQNMTDAIASIVEDQGRTSNIYLCVPLRGNGRGETPILVECDAYFESWVSAPPFANNK